MADLQPCGRTSCIEADLKMHQYELQRMILAAEWSMCDRQARAKAVRYLERGERLSRIIHELRDRVASLWITNRTGNQMFTEPD